MKVLVAGGAGYIGSHICVELLQANHEVIVIDDFSNSKPEVLGYIKDITGKDVKFYEFNILDEKKTEQVFIENEIDAVIHCAAFKAVGESVEKPIEYYTNNLTTTLIVAKMMKKYHVNNIVFSSSATVYGDPEVVPLTEDCKLGETTNPYGASKAMMERILTDVQHACPDMSVTLLRYFNPIGAHESGLLGEDPKGIPNNLMPYIMKVAAGELPCLGVFGDDYDTPDGYHVGSDGVWDGQSATGEYGQNPGPGAFAQNESENTQAVDSGTETAEAEVTETEAAQTGSADSVK